jgi:hypothetical protein
VKKVNAADLDCDEAACPPDESISDSTQRSSGGDQANARNAGRRSPVDTEERFPLWIVILAWVGLSLFCWGVVVLIVVALWSAL